MKRGELYRVHRPAGPDPRPFRIFLVMSRQVFVDARYSSVVCVPVYSRSQGVTTEVELGPEHGLQQTSWLRCDEVASVSKARLSDYVGSVPQAKLIEVGRALIAALDIDA